MENSDGAFLAHYRCPKEYIAFEEPKAAPGAAGFFSLGPGVIGYGGCADCAPEDSFSGHIPDVRSAIRGDKQVVHLPFQIDEIVANLRMERYLSAIGKPSNSVGGSKAIREFYYLLRPMLPVGVRKYLQRMNLRGWEQIPFPRWPIDFSVESFLERLMVYLLSSGQADRIPFIWFWPMGFPSATILTHDVEALPGRDFCNELMNLNDSFHIKSSFQIVPEERYDVPSSFLDNLRSRGFEINVHDLNHDGRLFQEKGEFLKRAQLINQYARKFGANGFRAGAMYRNQDWFDAFEFSYDMSVPCVAHLEPQRGGCCTALPYFNGKILEIPLTATQDYSLFHIIGDHSLNVWKKQIDMIIQRNGLISFIVHPDYVIEETARRVYADLLSHLSTVRSAGKTWIALPDEVNQWWRNRAKMSLVKSGAGSWAITGADGKRARIAYASLVDGELRYEIDPLPISN